MNFNSIDFFVFLIIVYSLYLILSHKWQNRMLLIASYVFYGSWDWRFLSLIAISTVVDYFVGLRLTASDSPKVRKRLLSISVIANLGILGVFKYYNFFTSSLIDMLTGFGLNLNFSTLNIILPVGISFYTFQTMSYTIDIYRGKLQPTRKFLDFALFVAFFPQLVAGPIERASNLLPRVLAPRRITYDKFSSGAFLILFGLFKKIVIADGVAPAVNQIYNATGAVSTGDIILATYLFAIQIYCDFSGYSDIARGVSKLMGFELMVNFRTPYFSTNPSEFWTRWHISLSSWLRDYLYIPLGGNRGGKILTYRNLLMTMILGGLWHGAAWNFILWGIYQGIILCLWRIVDLSLSFSNKFLNTTVKIINIFFFFQVTCYGWLLFRANSLDQVKSYTYNLFADLSWSSLTSIIVPRPTLAALVGIPVLILFDIIYFRLDDIHYYRKWPRPLRAAFYALLIFLTLMGVSNAPSEFIYFQF